ncbi:MAG: AbrB family transcriptional regulator [Trichodesmium sp. MAG_R03]|nr:AbrB family transcriptional regulator [Trichodesmium sp. MAG_R03]
MGKKKKPEPLQGEDLLNQVKELGNLTKEEKAKSCGYFTVTKNGVERVNMMKFLNALIDAEGIKLDGKPNGNGRGGRSASYRISVQSNGNLLIGAAYTKQMDLQPGDEFEISLGRKHIHLRQVDVDVDVDLEEEDVERGNSKSMIVS